MLYANSKYVRKSERRKWKTDDMDEDIKLLQSRDLLLHETSEQFRFPKSTLARRFTGKNKIATGGNKHLGRFQQKPLRVLLKKNL